MAALARLRLVQGRLDEAEALIEGIGEQAPAVRAAIQADARESGRRRSHRTRALDDADQLERAVLAELLGNPEIAQGDLRAAAALGRELIETGTALQCPTIHARGQRLLGHAEGSRGHLDAAVSRFTRLGMPYEAARARFMLAEAVRSSKPEVAEAEARAALRAFEGLEAGRDADAAAALLRALGVKVARTGPRSVGMLTKREQEVLELLGQGLSNPEIAERLYLAEEPSSTTSPTFFRSLAYETAQQPPLSATATDTSNLGSRTARLGRTPRVRRSATVNGHLRLTSPQAQSAHRLRTMAASSAKEPALRRDLRARRRQRTVQARHQRRQNP